MLLRARYDGDSVTAEFSADDGATWTLIGQEGHEAPLAAPLRVGLTAFRGCDGAATRRSSGSACTRAAPPAARSAAAAGATAATSSRAPTLDPKWELVNPSETNPPTVSDGHLQMPIIPGDLFGGNGNAQMILQGVPTDESWVVTAKIAHANIDTGGEAAGLALINRFEPNHFAKTALQYKDDTDPDEPGDQPGVWAERVLTADGQADHPAAGDGPVPELGRARLRGRLRLGALRARRRGRRRSVPGRRPTARRS